MSVLEMILTTALSAFFASLAAVLVSVGISRRERHRSSRHAVYRALRSHMELLWNYSVMHKSAVVQALQNPLTTNPDYYPRKPTLDLLAAELIGLIEMVSKESKPLLVDEIEALLKNDKNASADDDYMAVVTMIDHLLNEAW